MLNRIAVWVADVERGSAAAAFYRYSFVLQNCFKSLKASFGDFETEMIEALVGRNAFTAPNKVQEIVAAWGPQKYHIRRNSECHLHAQNVNIESLRLDKIARS